MGNINSNPPPNSGQHPLQDINPALYAFIEEECPILNRAATWINPGYQQKVITAFNKEYRQQQFNNIRDILLFMEKERRHRIKLLEALSLKRFKELGSVVHPVVFCKLNGKLCVATIDTGCDFSIITKEAASLIGLLQQHLSGNIKGEAAGFGTSTPVVGVLTDVPVELGPDFTFNIELMVIQKAAADIILFGADFLRKHKARLDFKNGEIVFPPTVLKEKAVKFTLSSDKKQSYLAFDESEALIQRSLMIPPQFLEKNTCFIGVRINGVSVKALIDSGADTSVLNQEMAHRLKIMKFADLAKVTVRYGLGTVPVVGKIAPIPVEFDPHTVLFLPFDLISSEMSRPDTVLLGCDFLSWYGSEIDFESNSLKLPLDKQRNYWLGTTENIDKTSTSSVPVQVPKVDQVDQPINRNKPASAELDSDSVVSIHL